MPRRAAALLAVGLVAAGPGGAGVIEKSDVVFMGGADEPAHYDAYAATWVAWGPAWKGPLEERMRAMHERGIHSTGTFWCLTAGARLLHENPRLREAVAVDIEGNPIKVPWLLDHVHEGTPAWFGCTNHPAFRAHLAEKLAEALAGKPKGVHIDDPSGTYAPASFAGGCFCDPCMTGFASWLAQRDSPALREEAGVASFRGFDYRELVRRRATTKAAYMKIVDELPLRRAFLDYQLAMRVEHIRELGEAARRILGPDATLSVNAYYAAPGSHFLAFVPVITHMVAEVAHHAERGTDGLLDVVGAYRQAETVGRPLAACGNGGDNAFVKEHGAVNLVKIWIALGYACGQRLMVPHPEHQWGHTPEKGTHWYRAPVEPFAPLYRFVREHARLFDGYETTGPLAPPAGPLPDLATHAGREALKRALAEGDPRPLEADGGRIWVFPRAHADGNLAVHLVNVDYDRDRDRVRPAERAVVRLPRDVAPRAFAKATMYRHDAEPAPLKVVRRGGLVAVKVPRLDVWAVVKLEPGVTPSAR